MVTGTGKLSVQVLRKKSAERRSITAGSLTWRLSRVHRPKSPLPRVSVPVYFALLRFADPLRGEAGQSGRLNTPPPSHSPQAVLRPLPTLSAMVRNVWDALLLAVAWALIASPSTYTLYALPSESESSSIVEARLSYETSHDFGVIQSLKRSRHEFSVPGVERASLQIIQIKTSCERVQVLAFSDLIAAEGHGKLIIGLYPCPCEKRLIEVFLRTVSEGQRLYHYRYHLAAKFVFETDHSKESLLQRSEYPPELTVRRLWARERKLALRYDQVSRLLREEKNALLVDIRSKREFEQARIPDSLQVPLHAVKPKAYLKSRTLVLFNNGFSCSPLEQETLRLRTLGFNAYILDGGLNSWAENEGPLQLRGITRHELALVPSDRYWSERKYENWVALYISTEKERSLQCRIEYVIPETESLPILDDRDEFTSAVSELVQLQQADPTLFFLVLNDTGTKYRKIQRVLLEEGLRNVFFLDGGLAAYSQFLEQQVEKLRGRGGYITTPACRGRRSR